MEFTITSRLDRSDSIIPWPEEGSKMLIIRVANGDRYYERRLRPDLTRDERRQVIDDLLHHPGWRQQV